jgi:sterol desaturase/sphingolipid hydroxylase (fatty acid hydroxylase superfamily)
MPMDVLIAACVAVLNQVEATFRIDSPYGPIGIAGALVFAALFYIDVRRRRRHRISVLGFFKSVFPARILWHPSSRLDMRLWIVNTIVFASAYGFAVIGSFVWRHATLAVLEFAFGPREAIVLPVWAILTIATLVQVLAYELGYWIAHYLFHTVPALWEFHKLHHSAEVLTLMTEMRMHPFEIVSFVNIIGLCTGMTLGLLTYAFGPYVRPFTLFDANAFLMLFIFTIGHLRHSHMWIAFTGLAGRVFQSPAHHQIHHSNQPRHFNKNLGFVLAIWDWLFGTLYVPETYERLTFGLGAENIRFNTLVKSFALPFAASASHLTKWATPWRAGAALAAPEPEAQTAEGSALSPPPDGFRA